MLDILYLLLNHEARFNMCLIHISVLFYPDIAPRIQVVCSSCQSRQTC